MTNETFNKHIKKLIWTKEEYEAETRILATGRVLRGIAYNSSTANIDDVSKENTDDVSKENTEKGNNKKVSFDNVTEEK